MFKMYVMPVQKKYFHRGQKQFHLAQPAACENFEVFAHKRPRSNLVIDVNFNGSFKIGLNIGILVAELLLFDFYSLIFIKSS